MGVIGAGPAGVAAAVQLARHGVRPVVFERGTVGGLLRTAWRVENFPGFPGGIWGPDLAGLLNEQLRASGAELVRSDVVSLERDDGQFVCLAGGTVRRFGAVIVASGTRPVRADGIEIPAAARSRVFSEVGGLWGMSGARVVVVGGGDAAFDYAIGLSEANDVTILIRGDSAVCLPLLESRARASGRVTVVEGTRLAAVARDAGGSLKIAAQASHTGASAACADLDADYLVFAVGREPDDGFLSEALRREAPTLEERREMLFAGDVRSGIFRQASIAAGQGTRAAMEVAAMLRRRVVEGAERDRNRVKQRTEEPS